MDVQLGPRTEMTEDRSDQGPKWMHTDWSTEEELLSCEQNHMHEK